MEVFVCTGVMRLRVKRVWMLVIHPGYGYSQEVLKVVEIGLIILFVEYFHIIIYNFRIRLIC